MAAIVLNGTGGVFSLRVIRGLADERLHIKGAGMDRVQSSTPAGLARWAPWPSPLFCLSTDRERRLGTGSPLTL